MSVEKCLFTVSVYKDARGYETAATGERMVRGQRALEEKNLMAISSFLGTSRITSETVVLPAYYEELLSWALKSYMGKGHRETTGILGYHYLEPVYADVSTSYHGSERILVDGQLLIDNSGRRLVVTIDARRCLQARVKVEGSADNKFEVKRFAAGIMGVVKNENYYRNKKLEFNGRIRFIDVGDEPWRNINLAPAVKKQIMVSTIGLLENNEQAWTKDGLSLKRCVLITGGADKDKKAICRALMAVASDVTCITADAKKLDHGRTVELYHLARYLSPCIVFLMNVDRYSQSKINPEYQQAASLISILIILGSVEEHERIVTVATASRENTLTGVMY